MSEASDLILVAGLLAVAAAMGLVLALKELWMRAQARRAAAEQARILKAMTPAARAPRPGDFGEDDLAGGRDA